MLNDKSNYKNMYLKQQIKKDLFPVLYENKENCCGCSACYSICPTSAIIMEPDEEGFFYPLINYSKCIKCFKCLIVCAFKTDQIQKDYYNTVMSVGNER